MWPLLRYEELLGRARWGSLSFCRRAISDLPSTLTATASATSGTRSPDSLASIANYLAKSGWIRGRDWGFEAVIPQGVTCALEGPDRARPIRDLTDDGHHSHLGPAVSGK
jgi:hypothetical protein